jgi:hypothetical protein
MHRSRAEKINVSTRPKTVRARTKHSSSSQLDDVWTTLNDMPGHRKSRRHPGTRRSGMPDAMIRDWSDEETNNSLLAGEYNFYK